LTAPPVPIDPAALRAQLGLPALHAEPEDERDPEFRWFLLEMELGLVFMRRGKGQC
jgi:hypothetical protein